MSNSDAGAVASTEGLGLVPDAQDEYSLDLFWHALNYRTAHTLQAEAMWQELESCVERKLAAAVAAERERCARVVEREVFKACPHLRESEFAALIRRGA